MPQVSCLIRARSSQQASESEDIPKSNFPLFFNDLLAAGTAKNEVPRAGEDFLAGFLWGYGFWRTWGDLEAELSSRDQVGC